VNDGIPATLQARFADVEAPGDFRTAPSAALRAAPAGAAEERALGLASSWFVNWR
jgi:hypothetical protein